MALKEPPNLSISERASYYSRAWELLHDWKRQVRAAMMSELPTPEEIEAFRAWERTEYMPKFRALAPVRNGAMDDWYAALKAATDADSTVLDDLYTDQGEDPAEVKPMVVMARALELVKIDGAADTNWDKKIDLDDLP